MRRLTVENAAKPPSLDADTVYGICRDVLDIPWYWHTWVERYRNLEIIAAVFSLGIGAIMWMSRTKPVVVEEPLVLALLPDKSPAKDGKQAADETPPTGPMAS